MKQQHQNRTLVSAGGMVYRHTEQGLEIVVCRRYNPAVCGLPKGTVESGETQRETALREVQEETGLEVQDAGLIGDIGYSFMNSKSGIQYDKKVYFYLMRPIGGDLSLHDDEYDFVKWVSVKEAMSVLTYKSEANIVLKGISMVSAE